MEEIKIGEYVRTNLGHIGKIIKEYTFKNGEVVYPEPQEWVLDNKYVLNEAGMYQMGEQIVKHSPNIIDLIEEGDYVNGKKVSIVYKFANQITFECVGSCVYSETILGDNIKSIVTKEMFNQVKYEV